MQNENTEKATLKSEKWDQGIKHEERTSVSPVPQQVYQLKKLWSLCKTVSWALWDI